MHNAKMETPTTDLNSHFNILNDVLNDSKNLQGLTKVKDAKDKLHQLQSNPITITIEDEQRVREESLKAIEEKTEECIQEIDNTTEEWIKQIDQKKQEFVQEIDTKKEKSVQEIDTKETECIQKIGKTKEESVQEIDTKIKESLQKIDIKRDETVQDVDIKKKESVQDIDNKKEESLQKIDTKKTETVQEIDNKKEETVREIDTKEEESVQKIDRKKDESVEEINRSKEDCIKHIDEMKVASSRELDDKITEAVMRQKEEREHMLIPADKEYKIKTNKLKEEIVDHYMSNGYCVSSIPVLVDGNEALVDGLFVMPDMKLVKPATNKSDVNSKSSDSITSIRGFFLKNKQRIRKVCIVGEAGRGKTTLCQKMISSWCTIHTNKETATYSEPANGSFDNDDQQFLKSFKFLFYIPLRNHKTSNVVEMIKNDLVRKGLHDLLDEVLGKESDSCLVILDGLDEWTAEKDYTGTLPDLDPREKFSVLITTRPWKLEVLRPKQPDIGQEIELNEISRTDLFVENVLKVLDRKIHKENKTSGYFFKHIRLNKIMNNFTGIPLIFTQIICMWYDDIKCGSSQSEIYCEMIEYLFNVADRRQQRSYQTVIPDSQVSFEHCSVNSLHIFKDRTHCQKYGQILVNLSELAYCTLFNEERENALVFQHSLSRIHNLTEIDVQFCLKVGLLSQAKFCGKVISPSKKLSFLHKTFQEFLAALYIANSDQDRLMSMLHTFKCLYDVHEMAQVLIFLSGMRPDFVGALSRQIAELADKDERVLTMRQSLRVRFSDTFHWSAIERVLFDCITEGYRDERFPDGLVVHDFDLTRIGHVFKGDVKSLLQCINTTKIKSLSVDSEMLKDIDGQNIVKLCADITISEHVNDLVCFIKGCLSSLTCLHVIERRGLKMEPFVNLGDLISTIHTLNHITCIGLEYIELSHSNIEHLAKYLHMGTQLTEIILRLISCISCKQNQCFYKIDLLLNTSLNYLYLASMKGHVELGQGIPLTTCKLESVNIGSVVECLKSSPSLQCLTLGTSKFPLCMETSSSIYSVNPKILSVVLPTLKNLRRLKLYNLDFKEELLNISQMTSLETMELHDVTMTLECIQCLLNSLHQKNIELYINMFNVTVNPKRHLSAARKYILDKLGLDFVKEDGDKGTFSLGLYSCSYTRSVSGIFSATYKTMK